MISVAEKANGRHGDAFNRSFTYVVIGTDGDAEMSEADAIQAVVDETPEEYFGLLRQNITIDEFILLPDRTVAILTQQYGELGGAGGGGGISVGAGVGGLGEPAAFEFAYQAPGGHVNYAAPGTTQTAYGTAPLPDFGLALNVRSQGGEKIVEGIDLPDANPTHVLIQTVPYSFITPQYEEIVEGMMGKTNVGEYRGRQEGTLRLVQVRSSITRGGLVQILWGMKYSPNRSNVTIAGIAGINIGGHQAYWLLEETKQDGAAPFLVTHTRAVYVATIFEQADFNDLQIPI